MSGEVLPIVVASSSNAPVTAELERRRLCVKPLAEGLLGEAVLV